MKREKVDELLDEIEWEPIGDDIPDDAVLLDALVIVRYIEPGWESPGLCWDGTHGMKDEAVRLGTVQMVHDRIRAQVQEGMQ